MKEFFAAPARPTQLEQARMKKTTKSLGIAPARPLPSGAADSPMVAELRAMVRSELRAFHAASQAPANDDILNRKEAADLLKMNIESVSRLARDGGLPHKRVGKEYRFLRSQLMSWMAARDGGDD
jgi:excisionase family DNA binding protein